MKVTVEVDALAEVIKEILALERVYRQRAKDTTQLVYHDYYEAEANDVRDMRRKLQTYGNRIDWDGGEE